LLDAPHKVFSGYVVSLAFVPFSGPEADDWLRDRKLVRPDWTFVIDSLRMPMGLAEDDKPRFCQDVSTAKASY